MQPITRSQNRPAMRPDLRRPHRPRRQTSLLSREMLLPAISQAFRMLKPLVNRSAHTSMESQLQQELDAVFTCSTTDDWQEGVDAFAERRPPNFQGQ